MNGRRRVRGWGASGCSNLTCSGRGTPGMLQSAYESLHFFDTVGASHLNDCIAFLGISLYAALCEH